MKKQITFEEFKKLPRKEQNVRFGNRRKIGKLLTVFFSIAIISR